MTLSTASRCAISARRTLGRNSNSSNSRLLWRVARRSAGSAARSHARTARCSGRCARCRSAATWCGGRCDVAILEQDAARGRRIDEADQVEDRGLAGAVRADDGVDLALLDREAHAVDRATPPNRTPRFSTAKKLIAAAPSAGRCAGAGRCRAGRTGTRREEVPDLQPAAIDAVGLEDDEASGSGRTDRLDSSLLEEVADRLPHADRCGRSSGSQPFAIEMPCRQHDDEGRAEHRAVQRADAADDHDGDDSIDWIRVNCSGEMNRPCGRRARRRRR